MAPPNSTEIIVLATVIGMMLSAADFCSFVSIFDFA
jgi:hypothetical protein